MMVIYLDIADYDLTNESLSQHLGLLLWEAAANGGSKAYFTGLGCEMHMSLSDYDEIVRTIQLYIDGFNKHDASKFREVFHKDAWIFYFEKDGKLNHWLLGDKTFQEWATDDGSGAIQPRIISVNQRGDVANVLLGFGDEWVDFHNLARIDGVWKITNKTATHSSRVSDSWTGRRQ